MCSMKGANDVSGIRESAATKCDATLQLQRADIAHHEHEITLREHDMSLRENDVRLREHDLTYLQNQLKESRLLLAEDQCAFDEKVSNQMKSTASTEALETQASKDLSRSMEVNDANRLAMTKQTREIKLKDKMLAEASASNFLLSETVARLKNEAFRIGKDTSSVISLGNQVEFQKSSIESLKNEILVLQARLERLSASRSSFSDAVATRRTIINVNTSSMPPCTYTPGSSTRSEVLAASAQSIRNVGASAVETRQRNADKEWCELRDRELPSRSRLQTMISKRSQSSMHDDFSNNVLSEINRSLYMNTAPP